MTDPHQPSQPPQPYQPPPGFQPPPPERRSGLPGWAIALIVGGALAIVLCIVVAIASIGVLTLLGGRVSAVFSEIESGLEEFATPTPLDTGEALSIGDTADLPDMRITITDARPLSDLPGARQPAPGQEYWAVEVTFENTSDRPVTLSAFSSSVQDAVGETYPYSLAAQRASADPGLRVVESLRPGATLSGTLFYEAPADAGELFWMYEDVSGGGQALFKIK